jgi:hypothetical protein
VRSYLRQLADVIAEDGAGDADVSRQAAALVEAQRVTAWGLRAAETIARRSGMSWRDRAEILDVPAATLFRQYPPA